MGDMNAERERVVRAKGKSARKADQHLEDLIEHVGMTYTGEGRPTHRSGTEIDHILVANEQAGGVSKARLAPGVSGRDHQLVWVDVTYQVDAEGCGPARTVGPPINRLSKHAWEQYGKRVGAWWIANRTAWQATGVVERAREMQAALTAVARQLLRDEEEAKKSERQRREAAWVAEAQTEANAMDGSGAGGVVHGTILHLFSGPPGREDGLVAAARAANFAVEEVDILKHP
eukprot:7381044-Prymnesium_polylepis.1